MEPGTITPFYSMGRGYSDIFAGDIIDNQENNSTINHVDTITTAFSSSQNNEGIFLNDRMFDPPSKICGGSVLSRNGNIYNNDQIFDPPSKICGGSVLSKIMSLSNGSNRKKKEKKKNKKSMLSIQKNDRPSVEKVTTPSPSPPTASDDQLNINTSNINAISCDDFPLSPTNDIILADLKIGIIGQEESRQFGDYNVKSKGEEKNIEKTIVVKSKIQSTTIPSDGTVIISISSTTGDNIGSERPSHSGMSSLEEMQSLLKDLKALNSKVKRDTESKLGKNTTAMTLFDKDSSKTSVMGCDRKEILDNSAPNMTNMKPSLRVDSIDNDEERDSRRFQMQKENDTVHYPPKISYHDDINEVNDQVIKKLKMERKQYRREANTLRQEMDTIKKELDQIRKLVLPKTDTLEKMTMGNEDDRRLQLLNEPVQDDELEQTLAQRDESLNYVASSQLKGKSIEESSSGEAGQYDIVIYKPDNDHMIHNKHENLFFSVDTAENNRNLHHQSNENSTNLEQPIQQGIILNPNNDADPMDDNVSSANNNLALTIVSSNNQYHGYKLNLNSDHPSAISDPPGIVSGDIKSQMDPPPPAKANQGSTHGDGPVDMMKECRQYWLSKRDAAVNSNSTSHSKMDASAQVHTNVEKCDNENDVSNNVYKNPKIMLKECRQYWQNKKDEVPPFSSSSSLSPIDAPTQDIIIMEKCDNGNSVNDDKDIGNNMLKESRQNRHSKHMADNEANPRIYSRSTSIDNNIDDNIRNVSKECKKDKVLRSRSSSPFKKFLYTQEHKEDSKAANPSNSSHLTNIATTQEISIKGKSNIKNDTGNVPKGCKKDKVLRSRSSSPFRKFLYTQEHKGDNKAGASNSSRSTNIASTEEIGIKEKSVNADENTGNLPKGCKDKASSLRSTSPFQNSIQTEDDAMMETFDFDSAASFYRQYNQPCLLEQRGVFSSIRSRNSPRLTTESVATTSTDSITEAHKCDLKDNENLNHDEGKKENSDINSSSAGRGSSTKNADQVVRKCDIENAGKYVRGLQRTLHLKEKKDEKGASIVSPTEDDEDSVRSRLQESAIDKYSRIDDPHPLVYNPCSHHRRTVAAMEQDGDDSAEAVDHDDDDDDIEISDINYGKPPLAPIMGYLPPPSSPSPPPLLASSSYYL